ncbi:MAG: MauE/DoxX family redox-associated membrane protein [Bacteroidota bacterium]
MASNISISLVFMAALYIFAGIMHFVNPKFFLSITPKWVPRPELVNIIVGVVEILLGIGLFFKATQEIAVYGVIALLIAVFPANIYHFQKALKKKKMIIATAIRLPIQFLLIYWAVSFL